MTDDRPIIHGQKVVYAGVLAVEGDFILQTNGSGSDISTKLETLKWIQGESRPRRQSIDEDEVLDAARKRAVTLCKAGNDKHASRVFTDAFEKEQLVEKQRREGYERRCIRLLEEALSYDKSTKNYEGAVRTLWLIAEMRYPIDSNERWKYLLLRAAEYQELGEQSGDSLALSIYRKVATERG